MRILIDLNKTVEHCLQDFTIVPVGRKELRSAAAMSGKDFEDNVAIACAEAISADYIITRDVSGFAHSAVSAVSPADILAKLTP